MIHTNVMRLAAPSLTVLCSSKIVTIFQNTVTASWTNCFKEIQKSQWGSPHTAECCSAVKVGMVVQLYKGSIPNTLYHFILLYQYKQMVHQSSNMLA